MTWKTDSVAGQSGFKGPAHHTRAAPVTSGESLLLPPRAERGWPEGALTDATESPVRAPSLCPALRRGRGGGGEGGPSESLSLAQGQRPTARPEPRLPLTLPRAPRAPALPDQPPSVLRTPGPAWLRASWTPTQPPPCSEGRAQDGPSQPRTKGATGSCGRLPRQRAEVGLGEFPVRPGVERLILQPCLVLG